MELKVGKTYRHKSKPIWTATIKYVGTSHVVYDFKGGGYLEENTCQSSKFSDYFEEMPPWEPEAGKPALYNGPVYNTANVEVVAIHQGLAWVRFDTSINGFIVPVQTLVEPKD